MTQECEKGEPENVLLRVDGKVMIPRGSAASLLAEKHFGDKEGILSPIEVLYLVERRNFRLLDSGREVDFGSLLLEEVRKDPRMLARYFVYRDWRDRGVFPLEIHRAPRVLPRGRTQPLAYPTETITLPEIGQVICYFFREVEISMIFDEEAARKLYYEAWIGQLGKYKQEKAGTNLTLDIIETLHLMRQRGIRARVVDASSGKDLSYDEILGFASERHPGMHDLLEVYEDWRMSGYIVKTGFKFGAHFRIYFPGAGTGANKWVHSKHILHVFPKSYSMLMSEWGRIIRLSQSVRKTFILGVPAMSDSDYDDIERADLLLYHRTKDSVEEPGMAQPTFLCIAIPETLKMSGLEFANALKEAEEKGLQLLIAVIDRETDINYYLARKIQLKGRRNEYYEIYWYRP